MSDVERYITEVAPQVSVEVLPDVPVPLIAEILRAALPAILAQHRADVLREAFMRLSNNIPPGSVLPLELRELRRMADEVGA